MKFCKLFTLPGGGVFSSPKPPAPPPLPPVPTREDPAVVQSREKERQARLRQGGRAANILTSPQGVLNEQQSQSRASELGS